MRLHLSERAITSSQWKNRYDFERVPISHEKIGTHTGHMVAMDVRCRSVQEAESMLIYRALLSRQMLKERWRGRYSNKQWADLFCISLKDKMWRRTAHARLASWFDREGLFFCGTFLYFSTIAILHYWLNEQILATKITFFWVRLSDRKRVFNWLTSHLCNFIRSTAWFSSYSVKVLFPNIYNESSMVSVSFNPILFLISFFWHWEGYVESITEVSIRILS